MTRSRFSAPTGYETPPDQYHDRYQRTGDGWKFTERVYEVRYLDTSPLAGSAPRPAGAPADPPAGNMPSHKDDGDHLTP